MIGGEENAGRESEARKHTLVDSSFVAGFESETVRLLGGSRDGNFRGPDGSTIYVNSTQRLSFFGRRAVRRISPLLMYVERIDNTSVPHPTDSQKQVKPFEYLRLEDGSNKTLTLRGKGYYDGTKRVITVWDIDEPEERRKEEIEKYQALLASLDQTNRINEFGKTKEEVDIEAEDAELIRNAIDRALQFARQVEAVQGDLSRDPKLKRYAFLKK